MMDEEEALHALRRERIVRVKRLLRWMPRRANVHRYPILKWFARSARKRAFLWSFRTGAAVPAIYAGCVLAFSPLYGAQLPLAFLLALLLRANLPILAGLQVITNPITFIPVYYASYHIGRHVLNLLGWQAPPLGLEEFRSLFVSILSFEIKHSLGYAARITGITTIGGWMMGVFVASILATIYRFGAYEVGKTYRKLHEIQQKREAQRLADEHQSTAARNGICRSRNHPAS